MEHSDILVVGAGSAGAAMAARLSEEPTLRVTLVEAGSDTVPGEVPDDIKDIFPRSFLNRDYFWPNLTASLTDGDAAPFSAGARRGRRFERHGHDRPARLAFGL